MKNTVLIKGNRYGLVFYARENAEYDTIVEDTRQLLSEISANKAASHFFASSQTALSFQGKLLNSDQQWEIIQFIQEALGITVAMVIDEDRVREQLFRRSLKERLLQLSARDGLFFRGTLRKGECLECKRSVVLIGDVRPGAKLISSGNIIVLGALEGIAYAGLSGNDKTIIVALSMNPERVRIGDVVGIRKQRKKEEIPSIAYLEQDNIYIESLFGYTSCDSVSQIR